MDYLYEFEIRRDRLMREAAQARLARQIPRGTPLWNFLFEQGAKLRQHLPHLHQAAESSSESCCAPVCCAAV